MSDLEMFRGDSGPFLFTVTKPDGTPQPLTGCDIRFTAKRHKSHADESAVISATIGDGLTVVSEAAGTVRLDLPPEATDGLTVDTTLLWDLQVRTLAEDVWTVDSGELLITRDVSRTAP